VNLAILGAGLVSPLGLTPVQHAAFARAGLGPHTPSAFVDAEGEPAPALHCGWLGARLPTAGRLAALARVALRPVTAALARLPASEGEAVLLVCASAPRHGLTADDVQAAATAIAGEAAAPVRGRFSGAAGSFGALVEASRMLEEREARAVVLVAVDSFVSVEAVRDDLEAGSSVWTREAPPVSEAAAAVLVVRGAEARELGRSLGTIHHAGIAPGAGNDDDDAAADGAGLGAVIATMPPDLGAVERVYGQAEIDRLRLAEWTCAAARHAHRWHAALAAESLERGIGRVGAAAGAAQLVYGLAAERLRVERGETTGPFLAWALSRDGTRGACAATAGGG
jgi:hypothetical protein